MWYRQCYVLNIITANIWDKIKVVLYTFSKNIRAIGFAIEFVSSESEDISAKDII